MKLLEIKNLTKYYGEILGVKRLNLELNEGEVFGFIGPNGAGKSTTIRAIMNLINKDSGLVFLNGEELNKDNYKLKKLIGYLPSDVNLYDDLTVKEMLDYHESFYDFDVHKKRKELVKRFKLDERKKIDNLSLGNLKKVGIILAFMHSPKLLILDEPLSGLDPIMQQVLYELIAEEKKKGVTIFYSTHILSEIDKICDRVGIIKSGRLIKVEQMDEILNKYFTIVSIQSSDVNRIIKDLKLIDYKLTDNSIEFQTNMSADSLIKKISKYKIDKVSIRDASMEEIFLQYYK